MLQSIFFIQDANGNFLTFRTGEVTNDNSSPDEALIFDSKLEAAHLIEENEWHLCSVVELFFTLFDANDRVVAYFNNFTKAEKAAKALDCKVFLGSLCN